MRFIIINFLRQFFYYNVVPRPSTDLDEAIKHHIQQVTNSADVAPDLGLDGRVHLDLVDRHGDEFVQNQVHLLALHLVRLLAESV